METASTVTTIISECTVNSDHNSTIIITQNNQPEPILSELINLDISNTLQKANNLANGTRCNPSSSSHKDHRRDYGRSRSVTEGEGSVNDFQINKICHSEADNTVLPLNRAETATRRLSRPMKSQPEGLKQCISAQEVPDPCRSVEKLHEFLPDCKEIAGPSQHLQVTQLMASIDGKEEHDSFNSRMQQKQPSTTQASAKNRPSSHQHKFQCEKQPQAQNKAKGKAPATKPYSQGSRIPKI
ncbi:hypothetical protein O181_123285 [Austropuccinia psidii MF-1]|uniref:Uncharacterized protein n=1 Tax=Austropuccinia psidii MF-1 TaxID=1389203 RepID=A0A9Q3KQV5_9BASI|nr:hypothetical protein [Austropuccinia psidii MF-1]